MAQFKVIKSGTANLLESLGNTSQMKNIMTALSNINPKNAGIVEGEGWEKVKNTFEDFGFTICYDRNLALLTAALFAAIARSNCQGLTTRAQSIIEIKAKNKEGKEIGLGEAFLQGDGKSIYEILNHTNFKTILQDINISEEYIKKYLDRLKKITPWKLSGSKKYLDVIKSAFEDMVGETQELQIMHTENAFEVKSEKDFEKIKKYKRIKNVIISNNVNAIPRHAFWRCTALKEVTIPSTVKEIGDAAFSGCTSLEKIIIPSEVKKIKWYTFCGCTSLKCIEFPSDVIEISDHAFKGCTGLKEITIPNNVEKIGYGAFGYCKNLEKVTISTHAQEIAAYAFCECISLKEVTIPGSVTKIGDGAFYGCTGLKSITIPDSVTKIDKYAFKGCPKDMQILGNPKDEIKAQINEQIGRE